MSGPIEPADDQELDDAIQAVLAVKADRAATAAQPFERVLGRATRRSGAGRRQLLALAGLVIVLGVVLAAIGLSGSLPVASTASPSPSATGIAALRRPLQEPLLAADGACPVTPVGLTLLSLGTFQGSDPVRVNNLDGVVVTDLPFQDGWYEQKVFWAVDARESGPILVRVARLDGTGGIGLGTDNTTELVLSNSFGGDTVVGPAPSDPIKRIFIDGVSFRQPGCYFMQMDGSATTSTVVFGALAAPVSPTASQPSLPPGGISEAAALAAAVGHVPPGAVFIAARAGPFGTVNAPDGNSGPGSGFPVKPTDLVWALTYSEIITICPPSPGASCFPPRPATYTLILDYATGAFRSSSAYAPAP